MSSFSVGRFAHPNRTQEYTLPGGCTCPGQPHERDWAKGLVGISASAKARIGRAEIEGAVRLDPLAAHRQTVLEGITEWNLLWPDPSADDPETAAAIPVLINEATVALLNESLVALAEWLDGLWQDADPNSAAPSRALRRGSGSRRPKKTPTPGT